MMTLLALLGCYVVSGPGPGKDAPMRPDPACTDIAISSVDVLVRSADVGDVPGGPIPGATVSYAVNGVDFGTCEPWDEGQFACGWEIPGHFVVTVDAPGYQSASREADVLSDRCHVVTEKLAFALVAADAPDETDTADTDTGGIVCTEEARPSVTGTISSGDGSALVNPRITWALADANLPPEPCVVSEGNFSCAEEVAGDFEIIASAEGYGSIVAWTTVGYTDDGCHVATKEIAFIMGAP